MQIIGILMIVTAILGIIRSVMWAEDRGWTGIDNGVIILGGSVLLAGWISIGISLTCR